MLQGTRYYEMFPKRGANSRHPPTLKGQTSLPVGIQAKLLQGEEENSFVCCTWCGHQTMTKAEEHQMPGSLHRQKHSTWVTHMESCLQ